jgi:DNA-directed RNA polymerase specialized sigma24 family protein
MHYHTAHPSDANESPVPCALPQPVTAGICCDAAMRGKGALADIADRDLLRALLRALATGSRSALARLHCEYFPRLVAFFAQLMPLAAPDELDDLIADTLFDVWRQCVNFASDSSVHVAIMRVAWAHGSRRLANNEARRHSPEARSGSRGGPTRLSSQTGPPQPLSEAFEALTHSERAIILLVYSGHSRQEVADIVSISCEAVDASLTSWRKAHRIPIVPSDAVITYPN